METKIIIGIVMALAVGYMLGYSIGKSEPKLPEVPQTRYECLKLGSDTARALCIKTYNL